MCKNEFLQFLDYFNSEDQSYFDNIFVNINQ